MSEFNHWTEKNKGLNTSQTPLQTSLSQTAENLPEKIAITYDNQKFTYYEIDQFSNRFAGALTNLGVKKGDRIALFLQNNPQFVIAYFGALKAGAVVTAINPLHREREVKHQLCDSGAQTIVVLDTIYPIIEKIIDQTALKNIIVTDIDIYSTTTTTTPINIETFLKVSSFKDLIKKNNAHNNQKALSFNSEEDLAVLQYTGGTTGMPKGVMLTHANLVSNTKAFASCLKSTSEDVFLSALPFFHVYGMTTSMLTPISLGATMVLLPKFNPIKSLQAIKQHQVTVFCGSPTMYTMLLASTEFEKHDLSALSSIRVCISGASSLPHQIQKQFLHAGVFLVEGYGLTEASPVTHCTPADTPMEAIKVGSIGTPLLGTEAQIVDLETGQKRVLQVGERGELAVRGPQVMRGYWQRPKETAQVLCEGWLLTGDIAYMDAEGYFYIVDRKKNLIKHKDYSIYPRELEEILYEHPAVKLCAIVGKPDTISGQSPKAFVVLKEGRDKITSKEVLLEFVNSKVAPYKNIKEIEICQKLPINSSGKILKHTLN
ncbi:MAG: long-chain fatty acid--CoA ligase [Candidatus Bathyarchaeota archaeon]|nr:long-chain fatty acid--CoA ligase [Candidatus Termiticorpusculum sp.]